ncbi:hypothetical protein [Synechococcus sp. RSCCF101]|uniref:hypothetical protein n=1 Tax=Synechococcus sp. RSCCF101 TaxID=2511069 RepID=UPI001CD9BDE3|nr:hypothetical protein [Synechococcus sp. RSCCF101]
MRPAAALPVLLILLALRDLRGEFALLRDGFTWSAVWFASRDHPLAVMVLLSSVSLLRRFGFGPAPGRAPLPRQAIRRDDGAAARDRGCRG